MSNTASLSVSGCLVSLPWLCHVLTVISTTASFVAAVTGAIVGCVTLYRMYKNRKTH